jgi:DNA adenine methylase
MRYFGSKRRIFKYIKPFLFQHIGASNGSYYEPFVGGANSMLQFNWYDIERYGWDINPYLIAMWNELKQGWQPPEFVTEEEYKHIKNNKERYDPWLVGYVGFSYTFGGCWFSNGGYSRAENKEDTLRRRKGNAKTAMLEAHKLKDVIFECRDFFRDFERIPLKSIVYCDPPYQDVAKGYLVNGQLAQNYDVYRQLSKQSFVYVSEYTMPLDFEVIMSRDIVTMNQGKQYARIEKLFTLKGGLAHQNQGILARMQSESFV